MDDRKPSIERSPVVEEIRTDIMSCKNSKMTNKGLYEILKDRIMVPVFEREELTHKQYFSSKNKVRHWEFNQH